MDKDFNTYYESEIKPELEKIEKIRLKYDKWLNVLLWTLAPACIIIALFLLKNDGFQLAFLVMALGGAATYSPAWLYKDKVKQNNVMDKVLNFLGNFDYSNTGQISDGLIEESKIIGNYNRRSTDDYICGTHNDISVIIEESHLEKQTGSGKNRRTRTIFKGLFVIFDMNKNFKGQTIICKDSGFMNCIKGKFKGGLQNVKLEDPLFEKYFEVYSTDQIESRYLLTTAFMDRLCKIKELFKSHLQASIFDEKIFLAINSKKDWFEVSNIWEPAVNKERIKEVIDELELILGLADILKLEQKIGL